MFKNLLPISALLMGSALLLFAGGLNGMVLPVRGSMEGFSALMLGLLGTGWAAGYILGCARTPRLVAAIGHIRAFSVMAALAGISILLSLLLISPWSWIPLRALSGFCFAGAAMIVESWLNERIDPALRGRIFGLYTMVNLAASTSGQLALTLVPVEGYELFVIGAIFYFLSLIPIAITTSASPQPLVAVRLDLRALWRNSPVAVFVVFMLGISNAAFGTLSAVYADRIGLAVTSIALFASLPVMAGALSQIPVGYLSDRTDRRRVLVGLALVAMLADAGFLFFSSGAPALSLALSALYGAAAFAIYPVLIAHANDHASPGAFIQTSGGILIVFGFGSVVGPLFAGALMSVAGPAALFMTTLSAHLPMVVFTLWRMRVRAPAPEDQKVAFRPAPAGRLSTPETALLGEENDEARIAAE